ncbi:hypothetical protein DAETH_25880 [Deinococcus aetherius]|uniref:Uncharacterized protein n=1 Tax=Deinococcus aetherius TaxID=200252 RepID=A0ABM8AFP2_9DEIO|nr:hypothetical protein DAETH_25880 [Deinococcus aetherius]
MNLLLIPPDVRPPTLDLPSQLARMAGAEVRVPPPGALPQLNEPGDTDLLRAWLLEETSHADVLVVCLSAA